MRYIISAFALLLLAASVNAQAVELVTIATGLTEPVDITHAGDERIFVVEQPGRIRIIDGDGNLLSTPFLNVSNLVSTGGERGLLGLAFHPNYAENGYFFINYTDLSRDTRVVRYQRSDDNPNLADPSSGTQILFIDQPAGNHNGGGIKFGPDGYLYIGMGDGGSAGDPWNNSQTATTMLGKMLRIDVDNGDPYAIPEDNPFANDDFYLDEIWATGLRNPWRFSFDRLTGDLWIGDVGQDAFEEIDFQPADSPGGENYGWRCYEGDAAFNTGGCPAPNAFTYPAHTLPNNFSTSYCSVTGGVVYRGSAFPELQGKYIYADFCADELLTLESDGGGGWLADNLGEFNHSFSSFGEDVNGEIYGASYYSGRIVQITYNACFDFSAEVQVLSNTCAGEETGSASIQVNGGTPPYTIDPVEVGENLPAGTYTLMVMDASECSTEVSFTIMEYPLPTPTIMLDGDTLSLSASFVSYQWLQGGMIIEGATEPTYIFSGSGSYSVQVVDQNGCTNTSEPVDVVVSTENQIPSLQQLTLSPNPFSETIMMQVQVEQATDFQMQLSNAAGEVLIRRPLSVGDQLNEQLDLSNLPAGTYFLQLRTAEGQVERKLIKQ